MQIKNLASNLKVIGEGSRLRITCLLFKNKKLCVSSVADALGLSVATTSHHLKTLERSGILTATREGKEICYSIAKSDFNTDIKKLICKYIIL